MRLNFARGKSDVALAKLAHLRLVPGERKEPAKQRLVVIGAGMVSHKLCERLAESGQLDRYELTVLGEEPCLSYDRVNLSSLLRGRTLDNLHLQPPDWFQELKIRVYTGEAAVSVDTVNQRVVTACGRSVQYDKLVFATGSRPVVPKISGTELPGVHVFRTQADVSALEEVIQAARSSGLPIAVAGAGLLGLELSEVLMERGVAVVLLEAAARVLPRQLTAAAAALVEAAVIARGCRLRLNTRITAIELLTPKQLTLTLSSGDPLSVSGVVLATGVRPRDELANAAGLRCDLYGGIEVDDRLQTSRPGVYAIGECARHSGVAYGLVAPGYEMADVLARALSGDRAARFRPAQTVTHLKMKAVELSAAGRSHVEGAGLQTVVHRSAHGLRTLVLEGGCLVGASSVGEWPEFMEISSVIARGAELGRRQLRRFESGEPIWGNRTRRVEQWPDTTVVCSCTGVSCGTLRAAAQAAVCSVESLTARTGAGSVCGTCIPTLRLIVAGGGVAAEETPSPWLWVSGSWALLVVLLISSVPPISFSDSVQGGWHMDQLWRSGVAKQISGFSLLALFGLAAAFSLRKRWSRVKIGSLGSWRSAHAAIGAAAATGTIVHTGMRLGENLDLALMVCTLTVTLLGAGASFVITLAQRWDVARAAALRRTWARIHLWATWPLPVLLAIHIFKAYYF